MISFGIGLIQLASAVSISKLLLEQHYPQLTIEPNLDTKSLTTSFISPEMRNMFDKKRNVTANFLNVINPSTRDTTTVFNVQSVNLLHSMVVLDAKKSSFEEAEQMIDVILADPVLLVKQNPLLTVLQAYNDETGKVSLEKLAILLEFLENECPDKFQQRMKTIIPLLLELETDRIQKMLLVLLTESYSRQRMIGNDILISIALGSASDSNQIIEHILIDQLMALAGQPDEIKIDEQIIKLGPLVRLAKIPCEVDNVVCEDLSRDISIAALAQHDGLLGTNLLRLIMLGQVKMTPYNSILKHFNNTCGKADQFKVTETVPVLNPREQLAKMKQDFKKSAASQLQAAKSQLEMFKSGSFEVNAINEAPMPKSSDMVKPRGIFDGFIDGIDENQLEDIFQQMKRLMQQNGIEADVDFMDFEKQLSNFVEHGSTEF